MRTALVNAPASRPSGRLALRLAVDPGSRGSRRRSQGGGELGPGVDAELGVGGAELVFD